MFDPPDFQMRPPVVGCFVILLLSRLLEITRDLLCTAIDAFPPDTPHRDVQRECVHEVRACCCVHADTFVHAVEGWVHACCAAAVCMMPRLCMFLKGQDRRCR